MSFTLYDLTGRYRELLDYMGENEDAEQFADTLAMLEDDIHTKVNNIGKLIKSVEAETKMLEEEKKRLESRISARKNNVLRLKQYLEENLLSAEMERLKTPLFSVWIQNNPPSVEIPDESIINDKFLIQQQPKVDKKAILDVLKSGELVDGAELKQTKGIRIR